MMRQQKRQGVKPISQKVVGVQASRKVVLICVGSLLIHIVGLFLFVPVLVRSVPEVWGFFNSLWWEEVPCMIEDSAVVTMSTGKTVRHRADIHYTYAYGDKDWSSRRYNFDRWSEPSSYDRAQALVDRYPPGRRTSCYVNPVSPGDAVLVRLPVKSLWRLPVLVPLLVGLAGLRYAFVLNRREKMERTLMQMQERAMQGIAPPPVRPLLPEHVQQLMQQFSPRAVATAQGQYMLTPMNPPKAKLVIACILGFVAVVWSVPTCVAFLAALFGVLDSSGGSSWGAVFFSGLFALVGLGLACGAVYMFLSARNPHPVLTLSGPSVPLGETANLEWTIGGAVRRIEQLTITLKGSERATYTRGTQTRTERSAFYTLPVVEVSSPREIAVGRAVFALPEDTMPSFHASHNAVEWSLNVRGTILRWPDINEDFLISVVPSPLLPPEEGASE